MATKHPFPMQLAQKISVSLDPGMLRFLEAYLASSRSKSRSAAVNEALRLLEQRENERALEVAYRESAPNDLIFAHEFESSLQDGLRGASDETW